MALTVEEIQKIAESVSGSLVTKVQEMLPAEVTKAVKAELPTALKTALEENDIIKNLQSEQTALKKRIDDLKPDDSDDDDDDNEDDADVKKKKKADTIEKLEARLIDVLKRLKVMEDTPDVSAQADEDTAAVKKKRDDDDGFEKSGDDDIDKCRKTLADTPFSFGGLTKPLGQSQ
jgi:hypothetical protein